MTDSVEPKHPHTNIEMQLKALSDAHARLDTAARLLVNGLTLVSNPSTGDGGAEPIETHAAQLSPLGKQLRDWARYVHTLAAKLEAAHAALEI